MRRNMHVRKLNPHNMAEVKQCEDALQGKPHLDPEVFTYPATSILVAEDGVSRVFQPIQTCYMIETIGYDPSVPDLSLAFAMKQFTSIAVWEANNAGIGEIYYLGTNEGTNLLALNNGYEEVCCKVFRLKVRHPNLRKEIPAAGETGEMGSHAKNPHTD